MARVYKCVHHCKRCGLDAVGTGGTKRDAEYKAEIEFDRHVCKHEDGTPMRSLRDLSPHLLRAVAMKEITEAQAWARMAEEEALNIADGRTP